MPSSRVIATPRDSLGHGRADDNQLKEIAHPPELARRKLLNRLKAGGPLAPLASARLGPGQSGPGGAGLGSAAWSAPTEPVAVTPL